MLIDGIFIIRQKTPVWNDECNHGIESYICSFENLYQSNKKLYKENLDLYVFGDNQVCIRFGNEPHEYYSPGHITNIFELAYLDEKYRAVTKILKYFGKIIWRKNE